MKILVTNDDGISSEGLLAIHNILADTYEVWVVAPDCNRSAASHSITLYKQMEIQQKTERWFSCSGTPADCVLIAEDLLQFRPDVVISGINYGANVGFDTMYSGTVAAARQAVHLGIPGIALSVLEQEGGTYIFDAMTNFIAEKLPMLLAMHKGKYMVNINAPNANAPLEYKLTSPSQGRLRPNFDFSSAVDGRLFCLQNNHFEVLQEHNDGSDVDVLHAGMISVSIIDTVLPASTQQEQEYASLL